MRPSIVTEIASEPILHAETHRPLPLSLDVQSPWVKVLVMQVRLLKRVKATTSRRPMLSDVLAQELPTTLAKYHNC